MAKIALFIDGSNMFAATQSLGFDVDYEKLLNLFSNSGDDLLRAYYYTALDTSGERCSMKPVADWLQFHGYSLVTKPTKEFIQEDGRRKLKGNMDVEIAVDVLEVSKYVDRIYLFSGDGDFTYLVQAVKRSGVRVVVVSTVCSNPVMIADELRRQADEFVDLQDLKTHIVRDRPRKLSLRVSA